MFTGTIALTIALTTTGILTNTTPTLEPNPTPDFIQISTLKTQPQPLSQTILIPKNTIYHIENSVISITPSPPPPTPTTTPTVRASRTITRTATPPAPKTSKKTVTPRVIPAPKSNTVPDIAQALIGIPYVSGGNNPTAGFDCSGLTQYVYKQIGISLPRTTDEQRRAGVEIPRSQAQPGDLIWSPGHVAIYMGGNKQIDAPKPGKNVVYRDIWQQNPKFIRIK